MGAVCTIWTTLNPVPLRIIPAKFGFKKTLFNIVEAPFKKILNFDVCVDSVVHDDVQMDQ